MNKPRIVFAGTPEFAVPSLSALLRADYPVVAVYTQPDRPAGRGRKLQASPIKRLALEHGLPVYQPPSLKTPESRDELANLRPELLVVAAYGLILPQTVLDLPALGCLNVHASLLPRWRGAAPIQRALLAGDRETGITIMRMEAGLDTGPMLLKRACPITAEETGQSLHDKLAALGAEALTQTLVRLDELRPEPQANEAATYAPKLEKAEARLDWSRPAPELERKVRAFNPWPVAWAEIRELSPRLWRALALPAAETEGGAPGEVARCNRDGLDMITGEGILRILELQLPGGKPMSIRDFLNSHPDWRRGG